MAVTEANTIAIETAEGMAAAAAFFYQHGGYSVAPGETNEEGHRRSARELAEAEQYARERGWWVEWVRDNSPCIGCDCGDASCACSARRPHRIEGAILRGVVYEKGTGIVGAPEVLASLWGICQASKEYKRVVAAELAEEAMGEQDKR